MLTGAGLSRFWHHSRTHRFFSASRWSAHQVGLTLAGLVVRHLIGQGEPIPVALDETLRLSDARYQGGIDGYLGVLVAQQALYAAQKGEVSIRFAEQANLVTLYKVLGGGV